MKLETFINGRMLYDITPGLRIMLAALDYLWLMGYGSLMEVIMSEPLVEVIFGLSMIIVVGVHQPFCCLNCDLGD